jgi:two-component system NtrC family sensor kinase
VEKSQYYRALTRNMVLTIILVSFAPLIMLTSIIGYKFETSYREKVIEYLKELVQEHGETIDNFLREKLCDIAVLAKNHTFEQASDEAFLHKTLSNLQSVYGPVFVDLGVVNGQGMQVAYAGPFKLDKADYSGASWFKDAVQSDYYISDVFLGLRKQPHFIVTAKHRSGGNGWILRATINFVAFNSLVESVSIGRTGSAFILNRAGEFQTNPNPARHVYKDFFLKLFSKRREEHSLHSNGNHSTLALPALENRIDAGEARYADRNILYLTIPLKNEDWILAYQQDADDAYSDLLQARLWVIVICLIGGFGIVTVSFLLSRRMVNYIERADREKEMMNERMIETGKLASIGELAAGVAHEINNPVAIMVQEAGWIGDLTDEEEFRQSKNLEEFKTSLQQIKIQGERCKAITQKLLSFARRTDPRREQMQLNELIEELVSISEQRLRFENVKIMKNLASDLPVVSASPSELQQVLLNLINNAIDAIEPAGGTIKITTKVEGDKINIDIADTGPGMTKSVMARIFEPFFTTKPVGKGTGLGLSICYGIVKKMGGDITVNSSVGMGTIFHVCLPLRPAGEKE